MDIQATLDSLQQSGNLRRLPSEGGPGLVDLSSNDYLGLSADESLRERFFEAHSPAELMMTSSASRLLSGIQHQYEEFEHLLADSYGHGRDALIFNSGYHANVGIVSALADSSTLIVADRLVHASIIDGIKLSGAPFRRFRHNDYTHLERILEKEHSDYSSILIIAESIYSMDGDHSDTGRLAEIASRYAGAMLYIDEAHAVGVCGPGGLGLCAEEDTVGKTDIIVGTLGKALASAGAFAVVSPRVKEFLVNKARPLIFSTALPPIQVMWSAHVWRHALASDSLRERLAQVCRAMTAAIPGEPSHIRPLIVGDAALAVDLSQKLLEEGFKVLPIRTPTVPPGTERLRFSLSTTVEIGQIERLTSVLARLR